ncbi:GntR family transcriptional regulator [Microbacterium sp.]|uniref:GntR family transcriptional regulator n=1 Tax=Microbacterium sp. TaxID=51671 RepID=UPI003F9B3B41
MTIFQTIAYDLSRRISDGEFPIGGSLPSEHQLAIHYERARGTVRHALNLLASRGMLVARQGSGWFIQSTLQQHGFTQLRSFAQWALTKGMKPSGRVVSSATMTASPAQARAFRLDTLQSVLRVVRIRGLDGREIMCERTVYAPWLVDMIASLPGDEVSVVQALEERFGIVTAHADHSIDAVAASSEDARLLGVRRSSPLLRVRRHSFAKDGRPMESGDDRYLPGSVAFEVASSLASSTLSRTIS